MKILVPMLWVLVAACSGVAQSFTHFDPTWPSAYLPSNATFDPLTLGPWAWYKADSFNVPNNAGVGGSGTNWVDQSGNGRNATEVVQANDPIYLANYTNGQPVIQFGPVGTRNSRLTIPTFLVAKSNNVTIVAVASKIISDSGYILGIASPFLNVDNYSITSGGIAARTRTSNDLNFTDGATQSGIWKMRVWRRTGDTWLCRTNTGNLNSLVNADSSESVTVGQLGAVTGSPSVVYSGFYLGELLIFDKALTDAECDNLYNGYLKPKWGI